VKVLDVVIGRVRDGPSNSHQEILPAAKKWPFFVGTSPYPPYQRFSLCQLPAGLCGTDLGVGRRVQRNVNTDDSELGPR
jgi:hypothetical protein